MIEFKRPVAHALALEHIGEIVERRREEEHRRRRHDVDAVLEAAEQRPQERHDHRRRHERDDARAANRLRPLATAAPVAREW